MVGVKAFRMLYVQVAHIGEETKRPQCNFTHLYNQHMTTSFSLTTATLQWSYSHTFRLSEITTRKRTQFKNTMDRGGCNTQIAS